MAYNIYTKMKQQLLDLIESVGDRPLRASCSEILTWPDLFTWPASLSFHHAYEGGLLEHTVEVCNHALHIASAFNVNRDILLTAALWHDVMKVREYFLAAFVKDGTRCLAHPGGGFWRKADNAPSHGHIIQGAIEFSVVARHCSVSKEYEEAVVHCLLSHHGPVKEWGSPIEPKSVEAVILHQADYLSAKF